MSAQAEDRDHGGRQPGAREAGGKTVGLNIRLPFEQGPNPYITDGLHFEFHYFFMRKFWFAYLAKALVIFPEGSARSTRCSRSSRSRRRASFRRNCSSCSTAATIGTASSTCGRWPNGAIDEKDLDLLFRADSPEQAFNALREHLVNYHMIPATAQETKAPGIAKTRG